MRKAFGDKKSGLFKKFFIHRQPAFLQQAMDLPFHGFPASGLILLVIILCKTTIVNAKVSVFHDYDAHLFYCLISIPDLLNMPYVPERYNRAVVQHQRLGDFIYLTDSGFCCLVLSA